LAAGRTFLWKKGATTRTMGDALRPGKSVVVRARKMRAAFLAVVATRHRAAAGRTGKTRTAQRAVAAAAYTAFHNTKHLLKTNGIGTNKPCRKRLLYVLSQP